MEMGLFILSNPGMIIVELLTVRLTVCYFLSNGLKKIRLRLIILATAQAPRYLHDDRRSYLKISIQVRIQFESLEVVVRPK